MACAAERDVKVLTIGQLAASRGVEVDENAIESSRPGSDMGSDRITGAAGGTGHVRPVRKRGAARENLHALETRGS